MGNTDAYTLPHSALNGFLFADVGVEASGMSLSVLSTLARVGVDPWQEAGRLARLPRSAAVDALARIIASMPASLWPLPDATEIAARLVALLPAGGERVAQPPAQSARQPAPAEGLAAILARFGFGPSGATQAGAGNKRRWAIAVLLLSAMFAGLAFNAAGSRDATPQPAAAQAVPGDAQPLAPLPPLRSVNE